MLVDTCKYASVCNDLTILGNLDINDKRVKLAYKKQKKQGVKYEDYSILKGINRRTGLGKE